MKTDGHKDHHLVYLGSNTPGLDAAPPHCQGFIYFLTKYQCGGGMKEASKGLMNDAVTSTECGKVIP